MLRTYLLENLKGINAVTLILMMLCSGVLSYAMRGQKQVETDEVVA